MKSTQCVAATAVTCLLLFGTKWASYLGSPPLFLTDLLLGTAVAHQLASRALLRGGRSQALTYQHPGAGVVTTLLIVGLLRAAFADGDLLIVLRDFVPYAYAVIALVAYTSCRRAATKGLERTASLVRASLVGHLLWVALVQVAPNLTNGAPLVAQGVRLFSIRTDVDGALLAATTALFLWRWLVSGGPRNWFVAAAAGALTVSLESRTALLALVACVTLALLRGLSSPRAEEHRSRSVRRVLVLALLPLLIVPILYALPTTSAGGRLLSTFRQGPAVGEMAVQGSAAGTTGARVEAWRAVVEYTTDDPGRLILGVGFGPDFMADSGARVLLLGRGDVRAVRSPHNFLLNTFARLGLLGLSLVLLTFVIALRLAVVASRGNTELAQQSSLIVIALAVAAMTGVVLEAPFGAIPFFWAFGLLMGLARGAIPEGDDLRAVFLPSVRGGALPRHAAIPMTSANPVGFSGAEANRRTGMKGSKHSAPGYDKASIASGRKAAGEGPSND